MRISHLYNRGINACVRQFISTPVSQIETFSLVLHNLKTGVHYEYKVPSMSSFSESDLKVVNKNLFSLKLTLWSLRGDVQSISFTTVSKESFCFSRPTYTECNSISTYKNLIKH